MARGSLASRENARRSWRSDRVVNEVISDFTNKKINVPPVLAPLLQ